MNSDKPVDVDLRVRAYPKPEKPPAPVEDDRVCASCGQLASAHYSALTGITVDPFGPIRTQFVLLCPSATFSSKSEGPPPKQRKIRAVK
jgi:hypothetical protein